MSGALQRLPMSAWSHTLLSRLAISSLPWQICSSHQTAYRTSLCHDFSCAAALQVSSLSELEISSKDTVPCDNVSSLPEPFSSSSASPGPSSPSPKRTTSGDVEWDHSEPPEPLSAGTWDSPGDPVPDSLSEPDLDYLSCRNSMHSLSPLSDPELEPEEEELDLKPQERGSGDGKRGGECDGMHGSSEPAAHRFVGEKCVVWGNVRRIRLEKEMWRG